MRLALQLYWCNWGGQIAGSILVDRFEHCELHRDTRVRAKRWTTRGPVPIHTFNHTTAPESDMRTNTSWPTEWTLTSVVALAVAASAILGHYNSMPGIVSTARCSPLGGVRSALRPRLGRVLYVDWLRPGQVIPALPPTSGWRSGGDPTIRTR